MMRERREKAVERESARREREKLKRRIILRERREKREEGVKIGLLLTRRRGVEEDLAKK
jgi:hypothetical protein